MAQQASSYIFSDADGAGELRRLRQIESVFDDASRSAIALAGPKPGMHCLEVGAGAGSIAAWLSEQVGAEGCVVAMDMNTRFLPTNTAPPLQVLQGDIREYEPGRLFDLVHARYVLIHIEDREQALEKMLRALAPGGWLVLEEPDFLAARAASGPPALVSGFERVNRAMQHMFESLGLDPAFGVRLPDKVSRAGLQLVRVENDAPLVPGQSGVARMMRTSTESLANKYVSTGVASEDDVANYCRFADDPNAWAIYYGTVRVCARPS